MGFGHIHQGRLAGFAAEAVDYRVFVRRGQIGRTTLGTEGFLNLAEQFF